MTTMQPKTVLFLAAALGVLASAPVQAHIPQSCHAKYDAKIKAAHFDVEAARRALQKALEDKGWTKNSKKRGKMIILLFAERRRRVIREGLLTKLTACANRHRVAK